MRGLARGHDPRRRRGVAASGSRPTGSTSTTPTPTTPRRRSTRRWRRSTSSSARARCATSAPRTTPRRASPRRSTVERPGRARAVRRAPAPVQPRGAATSTRASSQQLCVAEGIACMPYYALAIGFLTGKYRPGGTEVDSPRRGVGLEATSTAVRARPRRARRGRRCPRDDGRGGRAGVARAQPAVTAPIASARTPEQLAELLPMAELELRPDELDRLTSAHGEA